MRSCDRMACAKAAAVSALLWTALEFVVHHGLLGGVYQKPHYQWLWNPPEVMAGRRPAMLLAYLILGIAFAGVYAKGHEESRPALGQGLRYGLWIGLLASSGPLLQYFVYPISWKLAGAWIAAGLAESALIGIAVALAYRPKARGS